MKKKLTSVEWLVDQLTDELHEAYHPVLAKIYEQAKAIEKEQHEETALHMLEYAVNCIEKKSEIDCQMEFNKYYNETYEVSGGIG